MLLIDGYNLLFAGKGKRIRGELLEQERERLLRFLERYCKLCGCHAIVIFDHTKGAPIYGVPLRHVRGEVEVRYTPQGISADDEIIGTVRATKDATAYTVVTADLAIRKAVEERSARVITSNDFLDEVALALREGTERGSPAPDLSKQEVDFWMKEFGLGE